MSGLEGLGDRSSSQASLRLNATAPASTFATPVGASLSSAYTGPESYNPGSEVSEGGMAHFALSSPRYRRHGTASPRGTRATLVRIVA